MLHSRAEVCVAVNQINPETELSRPLDVTDLPSQGRNVPVQASPVECAALCRRFGLDVLHNFSAHLLVERARTKEGTRAIRVHGSFSADARQICVVTLEGFAVHVADEFDIYFVRPSDLPNEEGDMIDPGDEESLEPLVSPEIDLGELLAQHMALALDPYPRRPGVDVQPGAAAADDPNLAREADNPFAILGQLKHKM